MKTSSGAKSDRDTAVLEADRLRYDTNLGPMERGLSVLVGGALLGFGFLKGTRATYLLGGLLGPTFVARGVTGHSFLYQALGINTAGALPFSKTRPAVLRGMNVVENVIVNRSVEECYSFWKNIDKFPHFMNHVKSVTVTGERTSHWVASAPLGEEIEWDAEIVKDEKNKLIEWKALEGSEVFHAGSVRFEPVSGGRRANVTVTLRYAPPAGIVGLAIAKLLGEDPGNQITEDLERFKRVMEVGEVSHTAVD